MGGGGSIPGPPDPFEEAQAQILIEQERARLQEQQRLAELERQAQEQQRLRGEFTQNLDSAYAAALLRGQGLIEDRGLAFEDFEDPFRRELDAVRQSVPFLDPNPGTFFAPDIADTVLDRIRDQQRRDFTGALSEFAAPGFAQNLFPSQADDAILDAIFTEQYTPAADQLLRAFQRGNLTEQGYNAALAQLDTQGTAARSRLQDIGGGVLATNRQALRDIAEGGFGQAGAFELGGTFDPTTIQDRITAEQADLTERLEGDIRGALGGEQLFNIEDLISRGGIAQGAQNPGAGTPAVADALAQREEERRRRRGLGQQGVF